MDISKILDKEFTSPLSGESYGIAESFSGALPNGFSVKNCGEPFAYDSCGNIFTIRNSEIFFLDHETDDLILISKNWDEFISGCIEPEEIELDEDQILSVWVDPDFAKEEGMDIPSDGWLKRTPNKNMEHNNLPIGKIIADDKC
ncbi:SMI1/KNR4 family protein [Arcobacter sp. KX21116]|uniref:hypothetical protein n=1 Tax=Arcobacter iocasae TaxID=2906515 RepID=UPI0035D43B3E